MTGSLAALALVALLGACGGGSEGSGSGEGGSGGSGEGAQGDGQELYEWVECMRGEGIDVPDPSRDADGNLVITGDGWNIGGVEPGGGFGEYSDEEMEATVEACGYAPLRAPGVLSDETLREEQERVLAFSECMRENGVEDFPDPDFADDMSDGAFTPWPQEAVEEAQSDAGFEAADEECKHLILPPGATGTLDDDGDDG